METWVPLAYAEVKQSNKLKLLSIMWFGIGGAKQFQHGVTSHINISRIQE